MRQADVSIPGWPDRAISELAGRQRTMISRPQLLSLGVSPQSVARAIRRGRLLRVHHGVYSLVAPRARPRFAAEQAAVLACGPTAVVSHRSAAIVHGLRLPANPPAVEVTVTDSDRARPGIEIHTTTGWHRAERIRTEGMTVTSPARTLIDIAPDYTQVQLAPLIDQALRKGMSRTKLLEALDHHPGRPGTPRLRQLLDPARPSADTWSGAEARLRAALRRADLPSPESNVGLGRYTADLLWREQRVIVEYDSEGFHDGFSTFTPERSRRNDLAVIARHEIIHVTEHHLTCELERVIVWIALALERGGGW